jgi:hypothetical protein
LWAVSVSHPFVALPSQLPRPIAQVKPQVPDVQVGTAPATAAQGRLQAPQWAGEVRRSTSQPLAALPSQLAKPAMQVKPQARPSQVGVALATSGHGSQRVPQVAGRRLLAQVAAQG